MQVFLHVEPQKGQSLGKWENLKYCVNFCNKYYVNFFDTVGVVVSIKLLIDSVNDLTQWQWTKNVN